MQNNECKGCKGTVRISNEEIKKIFGRMTKGKKLKLVDEVTYNKRLQRCNDCSYLDYGTTCRQCGCIVKIKAKLAGAKCPYPMEL